MLMGSAVSGEAIMGDKEFPDSESYSGVVALAAGVHDGLTVSASVYDDLTLAAGVEDELLLEAEILNYD